MCRNVKDRICGNRSRRTGSNNDKGLKNIRIILDVMAKCRLHKIARKI